MVYEAIGDSLAMGYFWIDRTTGRIFVKTDLRTVTASTFVVSKKLTSISGKVFLVRDFRI